MKTTIYIIVCSCLFYIKIEMYLPTFISVALLRLSFICCNQEFSTSIDFWIDRCTLHLTYTRPAGNNLVRTYRVLIKNEYESLAQTDTNILKYSYNGINATSLYSVEVIPAFTTNLTSVFGDASILNVSASVEFSDKNITVNESTNITIICPIQGAYRTINVIKWKHTIGNNNTVVRYFTTQAVKLVDAKFEDTGKYHYTIEYQTCGDQAGRLMQKEGFVSVNFNGPPIISKVKRTLDEHAEDKPTYLIDVISVPKPPNDNITIESKIYKSNFEVKCSKVQAVFPYSLHGKFLEVNGYQMTFVIENVTSKWMNDFFTIYVSNDFGASRFEVSPEERNPKVHMFESFFNMNTGAVYIASGGVLFALIITGIAVCCIKKKRKRNATCKLQGTDSSQAQGDKTLQVVDRIYSPYEAPNEDGDCTYNECNQKRIERERQQIASTYSFGGFSLGEFHEEDITYNNDAYFMINQKSCAVAMNQ